MKQQQYQRHLEIVEGCSPEFAREHSEDLYMRADQDILLEASLDEDDYLMGPDLIMRYLPAVLEDCNPQMVMDVIDAKLDMVRSIRDFARQSLRHLELIREYATPDQQRRILLMLANYKNVMKDNFTALELSKQFGKILRHYDRGLTADIVRKVWDTISDFRALPPVLSFLNPEELPEYLSLHAVRECSDRSSVHSNMVTPRRYLDPTDKGECCNAELLHGDTLDETHRSFGMCTLVETADGTPVGSLKWEGYPSLLGLRTVIDSKGRHAIMPGAVYKVSDALERAALEDQNADRRFARFRPRHMELQPMRVIGDAWPGSLEYGDYRLMIADALTTPEFAQNNA